jgi:hypothetical protein
MKVITTLLALVSLISASPATSEAQVSSLERRALPDGWSSCGQLSYPLQVTSFTVTPYKPKWTDTISVSNIEGQVRRSFKITSTRAMVQIIFKTLGGTTINTGWISTPSVCNTVNFLWCWAVTIKAGSAIPPSAASASFTPSEMLASQSSLQSAFDSGATVSIKIRVINDYDGQELDCVQNPTFVA